MGNFKIFYRRNLPHYQPQGHTYFATFRLVDSLPRNIILELKAEYEIILKKIAGVKNKDTKYFMYEEMKFEYFEKFDSFLDKYQNDIDWLSNTEVANIVKDAIHYRDKKEYDLIAYTIMPNHVHLIFRLTENNFVGRADLPDQPREGKTVDEQNCSLYKDAGQANIPRVSKAEKTVGEQNCSPYIVTHILKSLKWYTAVECNKILKRSGSFWQHESYDHVIRNEEELIKIIEYVLLNPVKAGLIKKCEDWKWSYCNFENL